MGNFKFCNADSIMKNKAIICIPLLISVMSSFGQVRPECFVKKYFLLIQSTTDYKLAFQTAQKAAKDLNLKLELRGLVKDQNTHIGLSLPVDTCLKYTAEEGAEDSSCYMARGRWDDGIYISIEYSNAYQGFSKGFYIVVAGSSDIKDELLIATLNKVKTKYSDAYIKSSKVYMCCMH
jgi:hypothetical protein